MSAERMCMSCKPCIDQMPFDLEEYREQIRAEVIDDFTIKLESAIQEDIDDDVINQWDKGAFMGCVKFVAEQLKGQKK